MIGKIENLEINFKIGSLEFEHSKLDNIDLRELNRVASKHMQAAIIEAVKEINKKPKDNEE